MNKTEPQNQWKRRVALFLVSQNLSLFGSSVVGFSIMWYITLETSSGFGMKLYTIGGALQQVLISLFGGVWADRHNRKMLIMLADGFIALATLGLPTIQVLAKRYGGQARFYTEGQMFVSEVLMFGKRGEHLFVSVVYSEIYDSLQNIPMNVAVDFNVWYR